LTNDAPLDAQSRSYVANLQRQIKKYFGHPDVNIDGGTPAIYIVPMDQPTVRVKYVAWDRPGETVRPLQAQWETVPLPDDLQPSTGDDGEAVVYQPSTGKMWEFWRVRRTGAKVVNSAGNTFPGGPYHHRRAATRGDRSHRRICPPETLGERWSYPAQRTDGSTYGADAIPEGAIFRLPATLNLDAMDMDPFARMIAKAVQKHGMILWDISGVVGFRAENPANKYPDGHPFWKEGGILRCPAGADATDPNNQVVYECWAPERLRGFPWDKLQALKTRIAK